MGRSPARVGLSLPICAGLEPRRRVGAGKSRLGGTPETSEAPGPERGGPLTPTAR